MILAGDIGGTKVNLGLFDFSEEKLKLEASAGYRVENFAGFDETLSTFLKETGAQVDRVCLGAAGPVRDGRCKLTNNSWEIDSASLKNQFGFSQVLLVNDLSATAGSLPLLNESDFLVLQAGEPEAHGRKAVLSSGTGLGQAFLIPVENSGYKVLDTEGGHCGWAPTCPEEVDLFSKISSGASPLAIEDVLSGSGLKRMHQYFTELDNSADRKNETKKELLNLTAREIVEKGVRESEGPCRKTIDRFVSILGAVAGDMALQLLTRGGVYIGGGIPAKLFERMQQPLFLNAFLNKNKFQDIMKTIPLYLITNELAPLWGAAGLLVGHRVRLPAD